MQLKLERSLWKTWTIIGSRFSGFRECGEEFFSEEKELGGPFASWLVLRTGFQFFSACRPKVFAKPIGIAEPATSSFRFCIFCLNWLIRPHLQPPKDHKSSIVIFVIPVGTDGRTDGRTDGQKLSKVATKEKKKSLETTVATFSSPILRRGRHYWKVHFLNFSVTPRQKWSEKKL